jgi:MFS family permease
VSDPNAFSTRAAAISINVICFTYYNILALVLGGAADSRGMPESELGFVAAAFTAGVAAINFAGFAWLPRFNWKMLVGVGNVVAALAFLVPLWKFSFGTWLACNLLAGVAAGLSYGISIASLGRTREPERNFALAYAGQTVVSASLIFLMPRIDIGLDMFELGQWLVALLMIAGLFVVPNLPATVSRDATGPKARPLVNLSHNALVLALALLLLNVMAEGAVWAFLERIAVNAGLTTKYAATVIAISFLAAGAGSVTAAVIATRFGRLLPFLVAIVVSISSVWVMYLFQNPGGYFAGVMLFAAGWNLGSPYRMALATSADVSGRFSTFVPAMQTLGAAIGPAVGGILVVGGSFFYVYVMSTIGWLVTIGLFLVASHKLQRGNA